MEAEKLWIFIGASSAIASELWEDDLEDGTKVSRRHDSLTEMIRRRYVGIMLLYAREEGKSYWAMAERKGLKT